MKYLWIFTLAIAMTSCTSEVNFVDSLEQAHAKEKFHQQEAIRFDIDLKFGGKQRLDGTITLLTNSGKGHIETSAGQSIYFIGNEVYASRDLENDTKIRFDAYTWPYFFLFPYKLSDAGTIWNDYLNTELNGSNYLTQKLTFASGTGDAPDDWYVVYANPENKLIETAAYIVTSGKTKAKAEEDPHAISYVDYQMISGVPIATKWTFWSWRENQGLVDHLGEGSLSNIEFVSLPNDYFDVYDNLRLVE